MTEFFGKRKRPLKGHVSVYETNIAKASGMAGGPIEGPAKVRSERTTALIPSFSPRKYKKEEYCEPLGLLDGLEDTTAPDYMPHTADWRSGWVRMV